MRHTSFLTTALCLLVLLGAGCSKSAEPVILPTEPARASENMVGEVAIDTQAIMRSFVLNEFASCSIDISYPVFPAGSMPPTTQTEVESRIATFIAGALGSSDTFVNPAQLEQLADTQLTQCQTEITDEYEALADSGEEIFMNLKRHIQVVYNVKLNEYHLLTLGLEEYSYTGGAHANQRSIAMNIDRGGGRILTLGDIIKPEALRSFLEYEKAKLLAEYRESLYPESADQFDALIENTQAFTPEEQLATYGSFDQFTLTPTSIITHYNTYDIAPYAAGPIFVEIPYAEIKDFISMNGPLVPIAEKL